MQRRFLLQILLLAQHASHVALPKYILVSERLHVCCISVINLCHRVPTQLQLNKYYYYYVSGTTMPIIRSSRVLYRGYCPWYLVLWFSSCWSGVELRVMCPVCRVLLHPANWTHNPQPQHMCKWLAFIIAQKVKFLNVEFHDFFTKIKLKTTENFKT